MIATQIPIQSLACTSRASLRISRVSRPVCQIIRTLARAGPARLKATSVTAGPAKGLNSLGLGLGEGCRLQGKAYTSLRTPARGAEVRVRATAAAAAETEPPKPSSSFGTFANIYAAVRAIGFYLTTTIISVPLFCVMLACWAPCLIFDKFQRNAMHVCNDVWANLTTLFWYPIEVKGRENLPPKGQGVVYVANHQSFLDIFSLFALWRPFKFVSKTSIFLIPIIGWSMFLTGHVGIKRTDRRSQMACLNDCRNLLKQGASVLFFPEGTRSDTAEMIPFKKGAFSVAAKEKVNVVPITIVGTGKLLANGKEGFLRGGHKVTIIVHPILTSTDANELTEQAEKVIKDELLKYDYIVKR